MRLIGPKTSAIAAVGSAIGLMVAATAVAQSTDAEVIYHEYFNPWELDASAAAGAEPTARAGPVQGPPRHAPGQPPGLSVDPGADEVIFGVDGLADPGRTSTPYGPLGPGRQASHFDGRTDRVGQLNYYANFEPSVIPHKRSVVQNVISYVGGRYSVGLQAGKYRAVAVKGGEPTDDEDVFWGSFLIRARRGQRSPLPSVAPSERILEVQAEPDVEVRIQRDAADNFYLVPNYDGLMRVNTRVAVRTNYFNGPISSQVAWSDFGSGHTPPLPATIRRRADAVLDNMGISRKMSPREALRGLVSHYRNFEARPSPANLVDKDLYAALSRHQIGVCRHRSLAFMISARALGFATRYVYNEAHAFVEVYLPHAGWRRIDLGGAADELNYSGQPGGDVYQSGPDRLPKPPKYAAETQRMRQNAQTSDAEGLQNFSPPERAGASTGDDRSARSSSPKQPDPSTAGMPHRAGPSNRSSASSSSQPRSDHRRKAVVIDLEADTTEIFRAGSVLLHGTLLTRQGRPLADTPLEAFVGPVGSEASASLISLGAFRTDDDGRFDQQLSMPKRVTIGRWSVVVKFAGDEHYRAASSQ